MKIAYISLHWPRARTSGVGKKMEQQIHAWQREGHAVQLFMHMHPPESNEPLVEAENFVYRVTRGPLGKLRAEIDRARAMQRLVKAVRRYAPDIIYLRSAMYTFPAHRLSRIAPVVMEFNTNELSQHEFLGRIYRLYSQVTRGLLIRRSSGFVSISEEIAAAPELARTGCQSIAIGNSYDVDEARPLPAPGNVVPRLLFVGSPGNVWHGVEKLAALAERCPDLVIDVVGYDALDGVSNPPGNMILHGYQTREGYLRVLSQADAAFGSLALHRIGMLEGSTLKSREALAHGIPLILPYRDVDLDDLDVDWLLKIPNCEDNVLTSIEAIHDFAYRVRGRRADRERVAQRVGTLGKERQRLEFFQLVLAEKNHQRSE
ncbi:MAG TPA: glycosyltransferase [Anaerolineaceae bacterium]